MIKKLLYIFTKKPPPAPLVLPKSDTRFPSVIAFAGNNSEEFASVACMMVESMLRPARIIYPNRLAELGVAAMFGWKHANVADPVLQLDGRVATKAVKDALETLSPGVWLRSLDIISSSISPGVLVLHSTTQVEADWVLERGGVVVAAEGSPVSTIHRVPDFVTTAEMPDLILAAIGEKRNG